MLNAHSVDKQHVVGTRTMYGYDHQLSNSRNWQRLQTFVKHYAAPGAEIKVCCLPYQESSSEGRTFLMKVANAPFHLPGCTREYSN